MVIAIKDHSPETSDQQIRPAVVVVVADYGTHGPTGITDPCFVCDVGERTVVIIVVQGAPSLLASKRHVNALGVGKVDIWPPVTIIINQSDAATHRLHNVFLF